VSGPAHAAHAAELSRSECLKLLSTSPVGRIVYTARGLPAVLPVNFLVEPPGADGEDVLVCSVRGGWLLSPVAYAVVALQADRVDRGMDGGWWVTVVGRAEPVLDTWEAAALRADPRWPRPLDESEGLLRLRPEVASGRRIVSAAQGG
jgi:hypothetical protein